MPKQPRSCEHQLKRQAYHRHIRKQELQTYFAQIRNKLQLEEQTAAEATHKAHQIIDHLPHSVVDLVAAIDEALIGTSRALVQRIQEVAEKMVRLEVVQWSYYMYVLCRLLVAPLNKDDPGLIVTHTFLGALECGEILAQRHANNPIFYHQIMQHLIEYCYRCGMYLASLDRLQLAALISTVVRMWHCELELEMQIQLFYVCSHIVEAHFDDEEAENVSPQKQAELEMLKMEFINGVFYRDLQVLRVLVGRCNNCALVVNRLDGLTAGLRVLISITAQVMQPSYYYPLLQANILHLINVCFLHSPSAHITILALHLLNNMLVNQQQLTHVILREMHIPIIVNLFESNMNNVKVQREVVSLFANLLHFLNDDEMFVRELVNRKVHIYILEVLSDYKEQQDVIIYYLSAILIAYGHHPMEVMQAIRHYLPMLHRLAEESVGSYGVMEEILQLVDRPEEHV